MDSRRRGATWLLAALVIGRALDALDLPFEKRPEPEPTAPATGASESIAPVAVARPDTTPEVPSMDPPPRPSPPVAALAATPLRINRASVAELQRLPGVGPVLAGRIVAERESGGPFRNAADLGRVRGIGSKTCVRLAPHLRFD
jgi:competence ComEA-like helix-hairpin-helix protein